MTFLFVEIDTEGSRRGGLVDKVGSTSVPSQRRSVRLAGGIDYENCI